MSIERAEYCPEPIKKELTRADLEARLVAAHQRNNIEAIEQITQMIEDMDFALEHGRYLRWFEVDGQIGWESTPKTFGFHPGMRGKDAV